MTTLDLQMSGDAYIDDANPTVNHGSDTALYVGEINSGVNITRSVLRPDFTGVPVGSVFSSATLKLTVTADFTSNARTMSVYRILPTRDWVEAQVTWNIWKTSNNWSTPGLAGSDVDVTPLGTASVSDTPSGVISVTLSAAEVTKLFDGTYVNNGFLLAVDTQVDDAVQYASKDHGTPGSRPILTVVYESFIPRAVFI